MPAGHGGTGGEGNCRMAGGGGGGGRTGSAMDGHCGWGMGLWVGVWHGSGRNGKAGQSNRLHVPVCLFIHPQASVQSFLSVGRSGNGIVMVAVGSHLGQAKALGSTLSHLSNLGGTGTEGKRE